MPDTALRLTYCETCCQPQKEYPRPGSEASLSPSEVVTLAIFARWSCFTSERDFYRYAMRHLPDAFPTLPHRSQFNRSVRNHLDLIEEVALHLAQTMEAQRCPYEALDSSAMAVRDATKRRGSGWLATRTSDGATVWGGTKAFAFLWPSTRWGS